MQTKTFDVCIVGAGGMAAYALTQAGADGILLEAGGPWDNARDSAMLTWNHQHPAAAGPPARNCSASSTGASAAGTSRGVNGKAGEDLVEKQNAEMGQIPVVAGSLRSTATRQKTAISCGSSWGS